MKSFALMGIRRAIDGGRISDRSRGRFFDLVSAMWPEDTDSHVWDYIPRILIRLDRDRGVQRLLSDDIFTVKFKPVSSVVRAFNAESAEIPRTRLLMLIAEANQQPLRHPNDYLTEESLCLPGAYRSEEDLPILERSLEHDNDHVVRGAIRGLYRYHRFDERVRNSRKIAYEQGWGVLTAAEKHVLAVEILDAEVDNGGFAQYYFNRSGDEWRDALNGLEAIGAPKHCVIMGQTLALFPDGAPAIIRSARAKQLSRIVSRKNHPFHEQDSAWDHVEHERLDLLLFRYDIARMQACNGAQ